MRVPSRTLLFAILFLSLLSCGGGSPSTPSAPPPSSPPLNGTWSGEIRSIDGPASITWTITQTGITFTGTFMLSHNSVNGATGTVGGSFAAPGSTQLTFTAPYSYPSGSCTGSFGGMTQATSTTIQGTVNGVDCGRPFTAQLNLTKQ